MARSHFAIERPRKISISIEGYNAEAQTQAQKRKQQERSRRLKRKADAATKQHHQEHPEAAPPLQLVAQPSQARSSDVVEELEALNRAAAGNPLGRDVEAEVRAAFAEEGGSHANE